MRQRRRRGADLGRDRAVAALPARLRHIGRFIRGRRYIPLARGKLGGGGGRRLGAPQSLGGSTRGTEGVMSSIDGASSGKRPAAPTTPPDAPASLTGALPGAPASRGSITAVNAQRRQQKDTRAIGIGTARG